MVGQGTTFEVALPAAGDMPGVAALDAPKEIPAGRERSWPWWNPRRRFADFWWIR